MSYLLKANKITKDFQTGKNVFLTALKEFSLEIEKPEIVGLVGPNGAGKTTFIKHCLGLVGKDSGQIQTLGFDPYTGRPIEAEARDRYQAEEGFFGKITRAISGKYSRYAFLRQVGFVSGQKQNLNPVLSAKESLLLSGYMYDMTTEEINSQIEFLSKGFDIEDKIDIPVRLLSLDQRMRFEIISSVLHSPRFLFLDEPSLGLDFEAQSTLRSMLENLHRTKNLTILLTSHYLPDITTLCSRVAVIEKGRKVFDGSIPSLVSQSNTEGYLKKLVEELTTTSESH